MSVRLNEVKCFVFFFSLVKRLLVRIFKAYIWNKKMVVRITFEELYEFAPDKQLA